MPSNALWIALATAALIVVLVAWRMLRGRADDDEGSTTGPHESLDTVLGWPPQVTRILSSGERQAHQLLTTSLPDHLVLAQVPLARFLAVPRRYSYTEWLRRVGHLSADLLVCDKASQVIAVVAVQSPRESVRAMRRHERMARVLKAAGVRMAVWVEGAMPSSDSVRLLVQPRPYGPATAVAEPTPGRSRSGPETIPVGDVLDPAYAPMREPPPSTWFDDLELLGAGTPKPPARPESPRPSPPAGE